MKTLQQIQEENRKVILHSLNKDYDEKEKLTLNKILLAINKCIAGGAVHNDRSFYFDDIWFDDDNPNILHLDLRNIEFDLKLETLEEQKEKTQRALNEVFQESIEYIKTKKIDNIKQ